MSRSVGVPFLATDRPTTWLRGDQHLSGDRSVGRRALMFATLIAAEGADMRSTAVVMAALGDDPLRRRPVARIIEPLRRMGAVLQGRRHDTLPPLTAVGHTPLRAVDVTTPVPSARVTVRERVATRDHTERMLRARGVAVHREDGPDALVSWSIQEGATDIDAAISYPGFFDDLQGVPA